MIRFFRFIKSKLKMSSYDHMQQLLEESKNQPFIGDIERLESLGKASWMLLCMKH